MSAEPPALPRALDDDDDDVAWALQTAQVQWERGGAADAVVWLKRAAEAAAEAGEYGRSADIQRRANEIERWLQRPPPPAFPLTADYDDGVDDLLATDAPPPPDAPEIEAGGMRDMSESLVDALEAEARGELGDAPLVDEGAPVEDLGDVEDVEDIEAIDVEEFEEERNLEGYQELLDETTHARSEVARAIVTSPLPEVTPARPVTVRKPATARPASAKPAARAPASERPPASSRAPVSSRAPASSRAPVPSRVPGSSRAPGSERSPAASRAPGSSRAPTSSRTTAPIARSVSTRPPKPSVRARPPATREPSETRRAAPPAEYKLPPPPIPRLPLPLPKPSTRPPDHGRDQPRDSFPSEPETRPGSERPAPPVALEEPRARVESLPEVSATELDVPVLDEPPVEAPAPAAPFSSRPPSRGTTPIPPVSVAAPAELDAAVDALSETPPPPPRLEVALLAACRGLEDLPPETQAELAQKARLEVLEPDQEAAGFGLALVTRGQVVVMPTVAEGACGYASRGEPVFSRGTLDEGVPLRVVALAEGAEVAVWRPEDFEQVLATCPWVADELRAVADRFQALAGAAMGPLGERLDDHMRSMITDVCELRVLLAGEVVIEEGKPPDGLFIVGGGRLEVVSGGSLLQELGPGDLPFASAVLTHEKATATVRAGATGAIVLNANRMATHELLVSVPPLLELLSMS